MQIFDRDIYLPRWVNEQPLSLGRPPLEIPESGQISPEIDPDDDLPWDTFPIIDDFEVVLKKDSGSYWDRNHYDVYFFSQERGIITSTMWTNRSFCWDFFPIPTAYSDLDQEWELDIFEKDGYIFILESNWEAPEEGARRWYKVSPERFISEWNLAIEACKNIR